MIAWRLERPRREKDIQERIPKNCQLDQKKAKKVKEFDLCQTKVQ